MPDIAVIINPNARRSSPGLRARVMRSLGAEHDAVSLVTRGKGDGEQLAREALDAGCEIFIVLGGDGTVNEVAGVIEDTDAALCPIPLGGTNVFARAIGWPATPEAAISLLRGVIGDRDALTRQIRLWAVTADGTRRRLCLNAGVGIDGEAVAEVERRPKAKRTLGQGAFAVAAARAVERTARRGSVLRVSSDGAEPVHAASISVAIGGPYAYFGALPLDLIPGADFDGRLHWLALSRARRRDIARVAAGAFASGRHARDAAVVRGVAQTSLTITTDEAVAVQADGEPVGAHREIRFAPAGMLRVLSPRAADDAQESLLGAR
ncbi:MAG: diacylglycerol kinase family protein [Thermoleophilia bacterium]|nr:diacylglycerol kinase family protein [Thermoleophilia bacterium]MDH3725376.1 diacylglycerol kinase family protein [Thermoleophilia bacterium]